MMQLDTRGMLPVYFDTEFTGLHQNTTLISIGLITVNGHYFYAEFTDYDKSQVNDWIADNVIRNLIEPDAANAVGYRLICSEPTRPSAIDTTRLINLPDDIDAIKYIRNSLDQPGPKGEPGAKGITDGCNMQVIGNTAVIRSYLIPWLANESVSSGKKIQMYSDCLAYDWILFNNLMNPKTALKIPDFIYYIPVDLCTALQCAGIDPDIHREDFADIKDTDLPRSWSQLLSTKHNAMWDAVVIKKCFEKLNG